MEIAGYEFKGPYTDVSDVPLDASGVYVVVSLADGEPDRFLDVGESRQLGERLKTHDRKSCWEEHATGEIAYCYMTSIGEWDHDLEPNPLEHTPGGSAQAGLGSELKWRLDVACGRDPWAEIEEYWRLYQAYEDEFGPRDSLDFE